MITAVKNGVTKQFTERQWSLMAKGKNGWTIKPSEVAEMEKKSASKAPVAEAKPEAPSSDSPESKPEANKSEEDLSGTGNENPSEEGKSSEAKEDSKKSIDFNMPEAIEKMKEMNAEEAEAFAEGDTRNGIVKALQKIKS